MQMFKFPSIEQFRNVVKQVQQQAAFVGKEENGDVIMDYTRPKPKIRFYGSVKLHGTNAGIVYNPHNDEFSVQSRERILSLEKDNANFFVYAESHKDYFIDLAKVIATRYQIKPEETVCIYGEWCGGNIQKGVALSNLDKMFVVFDVAIKTGDNETVKWVSHDAGVLSMFNQPERKVYNALQFETYAIDIDFENPDMFVNEMVEITNKVEKECPVGAYFGVSGIGEGVVWKNEDCTLRFKVKGEKHQNSKVKTLATVDVEKLNAIAEFVDYACTENRLQQGVTVMRENNIEVELKNIGGFLKWVSDDIAKEEKDTIIANQFDFGKVKKEISNKARKWFMEKYA